MFRAFPPEEFAPAVARRWQGGDTCHRAFPGGIAPPRTKESLVHRWARPNLGGDNRRADETQGTPATAVRALAATGPQPGDHAHTRRCAALETATCAAPCGSPSAPSHPAPAASWLPLLTKLCATACAGLCGAHKDTAPRAPPSSAHPVHTEDFCAPFNAAHTPAAPPSFSAGPALVTYSTAHAGLCGTHTPKGPQRPPPSPSEQKGLPARMFGRARHNIAC